MAEQARLQAIADAADTLKLDVLRVLCSNGVPSDARDRSHGLVIHTIEAFGEPEDVLAAIRILIEGGALVKSPYYQDEYGSPIETLLEFDVDVGLPLLCLLFENGYDIDWKPTREHRSLRDRAAETWGQRALVALNKIQPPLNYADDSSSLAMMKRLAKKRNTGNTIEYMCSKVGSDFTLDEELVRDVLKLDKGVAGTFFRSRSPEAVKRLQGRMDVVLELLRSERGSDGNEILHALGDAGFPFTINAFLYLVTKPPTETNWDSMLHLLEFKPLLDLDQKIRNGQTPREILLELWKDAGAGLIRLTRGSSSSSPKKRIASEAPAPPSDKRRPSPPQPVQKKRNSNLTSSGIIVGKRRKASSGLQTGPDLQDLLLEFLGKPNVIDLDTGDNVLHYIASTPLTETSVKAFLVFVECGIDPDERNKAGVTPHESVLRNWGEKGVQALKDLRK